VPGSAGGRRDPAGADWSAALGGGGGKGRDGAGGGGGAPARPAAIRADGGGGMRWGATGSGQARAASGSTGGCEPSAWVERAPRSGGDEAETP
jgi:hypothetical protein